MAADKPNGARNLKTFAWQGIRLTVPSDWELISTRGTYEAGYVGLADRSMLRLQLKWDRARGAAAPSETVTAYVRQLRAKAKKSKTDVKVSRELKLASLKGKEVECYEWSADEAGTGMVSHCDECRRVVHVAVLGEPGEALRHVSRTVFNSLKDHAEDGAVAWSFFDLAFSVPQRMHLHHHELKTGCIRMAFRHKGEEMEFVRVSLAKVLLAGKSLKDWFREFYGSEFKHSRVDASDATLGTHAGLRVKASPWLVANPGRLFGRRRVTRVLCWHCEATNRLFIVKHCGRENEEAVFEQAVESLKCCPAR